MRSERQSFTTVLITTFLRYGAPFVSLAVFIFLITLLAEVPKPGIILFIFLVGVSALSARYAFRPGYAKLDAGLAGKAEGLGLISDNRQHSSVLNKDTDYTFLKRCFDIFLSLPIIVVMMPHIILIGLAIAVSSGMPLFYRHKRIGKDGKYIYVLKFRTMVVNSDEVLRQYLADNSGAREEWATSQKLKNDPRVTPLGRVLRKSSLDELPQLFNVLRGEMSLVGPRPIEPDEAVHYGVHIVKYNAVRPGLTGIWQVSGRSDLGYPARVQADTFYVQHRSFILDLTIILKTIPNFLGAKGMY